MTFDEAVLDDRDELERRDAGRLLWSLARAGAQVRHAVQLADEFGAERLADGTAPRAVLIVGDQPAKSALRVLARIVAPAAPVQEWGRAELPRWAGPADALLAGALDGAHPRVAGIVDQANRRGLRCATVAPLGSPVAVAAGRGPVAHLDRDTNRRAARWGVLTPLLLAAHALDIAAMPLGMFAEMADALDEVAETCRPSGDAFTNPAKALAADLASSRPVIAGAGTLASVAARVFAEDLRLFAGSSAVWLAMPDDAAEGAALLSTTGSPSDDDFFRDRDVEVESAPRLVTIGDDGDPLDPVLGDRSVADVRLDELQSRRALEGLRDIARASGGHDSRVDVPVAPGMVRLAAATAFGSFTSAYLALASGIDPSAPRPGELG